MKTKPKIIVLLGPTASGKSDLAVKLAKKFNGEVVSADSRQVYKGLNLGSGKITKKEMSGIPHHMLDVANPKKVFTAADYKRGAEKVLRYIVRKRKVPIVCGGTGFYIDALLGNASFPEVPPNSALRKKLSSKTTDELFSILKKLDPRRARTIDSKNPVRLIRAIEIATALGKVPTMKKELNYHVLKIGAKLSDNILKERIKKRLNERIKKGMVREVENLHKNGLSWKRLENLGLEYRYVAIYLQRKISKEEMIKKLETEIWRYVKRQRTWFKRDKKIKWFNPSDFKKIETISKKFLKS